MVTLVLTALLSLLTAAYARAPTNTCVPQFWRNDTRALFDACRNNLCFTFVFEEPYVSSTPRFDTADLKPFRCVDHKRHGLDGLFFDMVREMADMEDIGVNSSMHDALCVYGGDNCTFDDEIRFVHDAVGVGDRHQFIAGGGLLFMEHRRTNLTIHSQPWFTDSIVVLHRPEFARHSFSSAFIQIFQPFKGTGWVVVAAFSLLLWIGLGVHVVRFSPVRKPRALLRWFFQHQRQQGMWELATWNVQKVAVVVFFSVLLLLYEISVVGFVLQGPDKVITSTAQLKHEKLQQFTMVRGSVSETIFKYAVGRIDEKGSRKPEWGRAQNLDEMIDTIMKNRRGKVRFIFTFESTVRNYLYRRNLCNEITVAKLEKTLGGGWYYGASVPKDVRVRIDKALSVLDLMNVPRKSFTEHGIIPIDCGDRLAHKIGHEVLLILLLLTVGPLMALYGLFMLLSVYWKDKVAPEPNDPNVWRVSEAGDSFISSDDAITGVTPSTLKD